MRNVVGRDGPGIRRGRRVAVVIVVLVVAAIVGAVVVVRRSYQAQFDRHNGPAIAGKVSLDARADALGQTLAKASTGGQPDVGRIVGAVDFVLAQQSPTADGYYTVDVVGLSYADDRVVFAGCYHVVVSAVGTSRPAAEVTFKTGCPYSWFAISPSPTTTG